MMGGAPCRLLGLAGVYLLYLILGSAVFSAIEGPEEADRVREVRAFRQRFLQQHPCVTGKYYDLCRYGPMFG